MREALVDRGKPADYGQEIVKRRRRLTTARVELKGMTVLDFGSGNGAQTVEFVDTDCRIIAVDIDRQDLEELSSYLKRHNVNTILPVRVNGDRLPICDASVDIVVSYEVLEHVQSESETLREIHRVLKPGGEVVLSVPNKAWVFETHGTYLPLLPWNRVPFFSWLPRGIHRKFAKARIYRKSQIVRLMTSHSFEVLEAAYITAPMDVAKPLWLKKLLRATLFTGDTTTVPFLATAILVHGRKQ